MKRTATLVAGLLLVTGTVFAATTVTPTGSVEYKNTVFATDKAVLQHNQDRTAWDAQGFKVNVKTQFNANNSLELTTTDVETDPEDLTIIYKYTGKPTTVEAKTTDLGKTVKFTVENEVGRTKAHLQGNLVTTSATGTSEFTLLDDDDAVYLQYKATDKLTTTFYPYRTKFAVDTIFTDKLAADELFGIKNNTGTVALDDFEKVQAASGIKVEGYGLAVKVGTGATQKTTTSQDLTYAASAEYNKTVGAVTVKVGAALSTIGNEAGNVNEKGNSPARAAKTTLGAVVKYKGTVNVEADVLVADGTAADNSRDFTGLYVGADTKVAGVNLIAQASNRKFGTQTAYNGIYLEANKTLAKINGVEPKVIVSYKDVNLATDANGKAVAGTLTGKVEATVTRDAITVTPALEIANADNGTGSKTTTTATVAVKYSF